MKKKVAIKSVERLGNKGLETRQNLMDAARRLLNRLSPLNVTAAAVAKEAGVAGATFYVYFDDIEDILWHLCDSIAEETTDLFADDKLLRDNARLEEDALAFVRAYNEIWNRHGSLLTLRNLESDRGNARFNQLFTRIALPILRGLTNRIVAAAPAGTQITRREANAEAVVFYAAMDRIAAAVNLYPGDGVTPELLQRAQADVLVRMLRRQ